MTDRTDGCRNLQSIERGNKSVRIGFLVTNASYALMQQRIAGLEQLGIESRVLAFERDWYPGKAWPHGYECLGKLRDGRYVERLPTIARAVEPVRRAARELDVIYAFGLDSLLLGWTASRFLGRPVKLVYDVFDIRDILFKSGPIPTGLRWLERFMFRYVTLLVVTSEAYVSGYYEGILNLANLRYTVIENKLDADLLQMAPKSGPHDSNVLRIGYFGVLRCPRAWEILKRVAVEGQGRVEVQVSGFPSVCLPDLEAEAQTVPGVHYAGPYVSPDDLPEVYRRVDIVWAGYHYEGNKMGNWQLARTRRFYESCFFQKPMIVQAQTEDGRVVKNLGLGLCLDLSDVEVAVRQILSITEADLTQWQKNVARLPRETYVHSDEKREYREVIEAIQVANKEGHG